MTDLIVEPMGAKGFWIGFIIGFELGGLDVGAAPALGTQAR